MHKILYMQVSDSYWRQQSSTIGISASLFSYIAIGVYFLLNQSMGKPMKSYLPPNKSVFYTTCYSQLLGHHGERNVYGSMRSKLNFGCITHLTVLQLWSSNAKEPERILVWETMPFTDFLPTGPQELNVQSTQYFTYLEAWGTLLSWRRIAEKYKEFEGLL